MSSLIAIRKKCCCEDNKNFVLECFPQMCEASSSGDGWRNLFGYSAGDIRRDLRFFVRITEAQVLELASHGFPEKPFLWWDGSLEGPQRAGGGQVWKIRKDPGCCPNSLRGHKDFLFGNDKESLPDDPRDFRPPLVPPPNAFIFGETDEGDAIRDVDGVWLEVVLATNYHKGREFPGDDGFNNVSKRLTNTQYDNFGVVTLDGPLEPEFTVVDFQEINETTDPETGEVSRELGEEGFIFDGLSGIPREQNSIFQRVSHLFHEVWNTSATNFSNFKIGDGIDDETGELVMLEPGAYQPTFPGSQPDTKENIYYWQRWIAHAHSRSGMRQLQFAVLFDHFSPDKSYTYIVKSFPNQAPEGTSGEDFIAGLGDGTYNCNAELGYSQPDYPEGMKIAQRYDIALNGNEVRLTAPEVLEWPRFGDPESPDYPNDLRNGLAAKTAPEQCDDPATNCFKKWGMETASVKSSAIVMEFKTTETKVLGSPLTSNDGLGFLGSNPTQQTGGFVGDIDHYTDEIDKTGNTDRIFGWPTVANAGKTLPLNYCGQDTFSDCCGSDVGDGLSRTTKQRNRKDAED